MAVSAPGGRERVALEGYLFARSLLFPSAHHEVRDRNRHPRSALFEPELDEINETLSRDVSGDAGIVNDNARNELYLRHHPPNRGPDHGVPFPA